jgi:GNAT superfamily N-acetyltransferase
VVDRAAPAVVVRAAAVDALAPAGPGMGVVHAAAAGPRLAPPLTEEGWNVYRLLVMVHDREPERRPEPRLGAEVDRKTGARALAAFRREQPFGWQPEAVEQLHAMDERFGRAVTARDFAAPADDPAAACRLYTHDGLAQIDEVGTLERRRNRGYASAAVLAAVEAARAEGCDPIFLLTDASDWPQQLYSRLGFSPIGLEYEFLKLPLRSRRP